MSEPMDAERLNEALRFQDKINDRHEAAIEMLRSDANEIKMALLQGSVDVANIKEKHLQYQIEQDTRLAKMEHHQASNTKLRYWLTGYLALLSTLFVASATLFADWIKKKLGI